MGGKSIKVTHDVYAALEAIKREKGLRSPNEAIKKLLEGKVEKVRVEVPETEEKPRKRRVVIREPVEGGDGHRRLLVDIKAMLFRLDQRLSGLERRLEEGNFRGEGFTEIPSRCPYCGQPLRNMLQEPHIILTDLGIEVYYRACPTCMKPLSDLRWKPLKSSTKSSKNSEKSNNSSRPRVINIHQP